MIRVRVVGNGWSGGPGLSTFYFREGILPVDAAMAANLTGRVRAYFHEMRPYTANEVTWQVDPVIANMDPTTGQVSQEVAATSAPAPVVGTSTFDLGPTFVSLLGRLRTNAFASGRRIQGRTYYSPLAAAFTDSPQPETTAQAAQVTGLNAILTTGGGAPLVVWRRPRPGVAGNIFDVVTVSSAPEFGVLRSRR